MAASTMRTSWAVPSAGSKGSTLHVLPFDSKIKHSLPSTIILAWISNSDLEIVKWLTSFVLFDVICLVIATLDIWALRVTNTVSHLRWFGVKAPTLGLKQRDQAFLPPILKIVLSFDDVTGNGITLGTTGVAAVTSATIGVGVGSEADVGIVVEVFRW